MPTLLKDETRLTGIVIHTGNADGIHIEFPRQIKVLTLSVDACRELAGKLNRAALIEQRVVLAMAGSIMGPM